MKLAEGVGGCSVVGRVLMKGYDCTYILIVNSCLPAWQFMKQYERTYTLLFAHERVI